MSNNTIAVESVRGTNITGYSIEARLTGNKQILIVEKTEENDDMNGVLVSPEFIKQIAHYIDLNSDAWKTIDGNN